MDVYKVRTSLGTMLTVLGPKMLMIGKLGLPLIVITAVELLFWLKKLVTVIEILYVAEGINALGMVITEVVFWPYSFRAARIALVSALGVAETDQVSDCQERPPEPLVRVGSIFTSSQVEIEAGMLSTTVGTTGELGAIRETVLR